MISGNDPPELGPAAPKLTLTLGIFRKSYPGVRAHETGSQPAQETAIPHVKARIRI